MKASRSKRKCSVEGLKKRRAPNPWSPVKGVKRNPAGYNGSKSRTLKRKLDVGAAFSAKSIVDSDKNSTVVKTHHRKRRLQKWRRGKGVWNQKQYEKRQELLRQVKLSAEKHRRIVEYKENLDELES